MLFEHDGPNIITEFEFLKSSIDPNIIELVINERRKHYRKLNIEKSLNEDVGFPDKHALSEFLGHLKKISIFKDAELKLYKQVGTDSSSTFVQVYKFNSYFVMLSTYIGSCPGCILSAQNFPKGFVREDYVDNQTLDEATRYYKKSIFLYLEQQVAKASIHETYEAALTEYNDLKYDSGLETDSSSDSESETE
tara:strand:+ start:138 stop:716 length:579 start_codon:yes stop_codon:yes gene_type:complete